MKYNMTRAEVENCGLVGTKIISETASVRQVRVLGAFDLFVLKDDLSLSPHLTDEGFWEAWITSWLTKWLRPGMTFIDIGANSGYYTMIAEVLVGRYGNVVAYEPNPAYAELLRQTRGANDATFKIREVAVSDNVGMATLSVPVDHHGNASIAFDFADLSELTQVYDVKKTTLDSEVLGLTFFRNDIIKIDAEGAEEMIWNGASRILNAPDHATFMIEHTPGAYSDQFLDKLFEWGSVSIITHDGNEMRVSKNWIASQSDWCMIVVRKK